ncbi:kinetochore-associated Ndc80 complex subunit spc24 [Thelotrema lepadinum]|nr:kinetochore-associated Ndc80 complex subunit spc24 [Thelotrema lepadinum]
MLLDEEPAKLINTMIANFALPPDKAAIARINESLSDIHETRDLRKSEAESALKKLSRTHNLLNSQHAEALSSHSSTIHASHIVELDTQKFRIAKAASDLEIESERLEAELEGLKGRLQALDLQGVEGDGSAVARARREGEDETVLKLKVYRTLGIDVEPDAAGQFAKAVVRNSARGDVHVVNIDPKFSRFYYANYFWSTI